MELNIGENITFRQLNVKLLENVSIYNNYSTV